MNVTSIGAIRTGDSDPQGDVQVACVPPTPRPESVLPWLPCRLALTLRVVRFTLRDLLGLRVGSLFETSYQRGSDLPLWVNGQFLAWTEFEAAGDRLAVRLTDLS